MNSAVDPAEISVTLVTVSDRSHRGERDDLSGQAAARAVEQAGLSLRDTKLIPDGRQPVGAALSAAIEDGADLVLTLGGTGIGPRDETPEGTRPLLETELPGIAEGLRLAGAAKVPAAALSRGLAGVSRPSRAGHRSVIINLPGSTGGVRDGFGYLVPILPHLVDQLRGGDH
ncbi:MAG: MogA/MoaB family molybdenum cofactor biosynthesis protein [Solirubrobacterales bacterium]|nr:MogA/MoaB family molybdenum cofactor biosynthesis protein [Solirubrobacterales bacterium]